MINDQEKYLNLFFNAFFIYHQEKNNLLLDNLEIFLQLMHNYDKLTHDFVCNNHIKFDNKKIKKTTIVDNIKIINSFYDKMGIRLNVE